MTDPRPYYRKFNIYRRNEDGTDGALVEDDTFTLIPGHDPHAVVALQSYATSIQYDNPKLAGDLQRLAGKHR